MFNVPEEHRIVTGSYGSNPNSGNNGAFSVPVPSRKKERFMVIASDGQGWEHVSVSHKNRTPTWEEMCHIKDMFWDEDDVVVQFHPAKNEYINLHENCLHLWKPIKIPLPTPDKALLGFDDYDEFIAYQLGLLTNDDMQEKLIVAKAMIKYGGSFVNRLGSLLLKADRSNFAIIKQIWPNTYHEYLELAKKGQNDE